MNLCLNYTQRICYVQDEKNQKYYNEKKLMEVRKVNTRERAIGTLEFRNMHGEGCVLETFFPWDKTVRHWIGQGLSPQFSPEHIYPWARDDETERNYLSRGMTEGVAAYERELGFDDLRRVSFQIPFFRFCKEGEIKDFSAWEKVKVLVRQEMEKYCTEENFERIFGIYREGHERGEYSVRMRASGFFWTPRDLMGIEDHLFAFYDEPELMHDMNEFVLEMYLKYLVPLVKILQPEVFLFPEDLSGKNGPMLSPECFDEFVGAYYQRLFPVLRENGVKNIFVDTDGDFRLLIPNFMKAGVDGFLPMDVNAGMDIVAVRKEFPELKFIGAFNKLVLLENREAIDKEFERIMPVIRQGGYIPGLDHQAAPNTSLENYKYYIEKLKEAMKEAGADL